MANSELSWGAVLAGAGEREATEVLAAAIEAVATRTSRTEANQPLSAALEQWLSTSQAPAEAESPPQTGLATASAPEANRPLSALEQLLAADQAQARAITENTTAVLESATTRTTSDSGSGSIAGSIVSKLFGSALAVTPLIGGLIKLFGGGGSSDTTLTPLNVYTPPPPLGFEGAVDRDRGLTEWSVPEPAGRGRAQTVVMPQVTVQVSAMDSQSFLDHSDDIARAVKQAMLNSHGLNDVVNEL